MRWYGNNSVQSIEIAITKIVDIAIRTGYCIEFTNYKVKNTGRVNKLKYKQWVQKGVFMTKTTTTKCKIESDKPTLKKKKKTMK